MKKIYVLDTSTYLSDFRSLFAFGKNDIIIPLIVLEEIDNHKRRSDTVGTNARGIIRTLDELRSKGSILNGIRIKKNLGFVTAKSFDTNDLPLGYDATKPDHQIIGTAITTQKNNPNKKVVVVSCDINMRVKCDAIGISSQDYTPDHIIKEKSQLYSGSTSIIVDDTFIDAFYNNEASFILDYKSIKLYPNEFLLLTSNKNPKKTALARYIDDNSPLKKIKEINGVCGISTKNKEQSFALDLLMDPLVSVVTLVGKSGCGKTIMACAAGLEQIGQKKKQLYNRLIVSRPIQPLGKDIGFLPGTLEEKMTPWLSPIQDNLRSLLGNDRIMLEEYIDKGIIEIEALTYIRGRSIENAFIIIDETQNINRHEIKTILTRVGNNSKIILTGDIDQIDNISVDETSNGLTHAVEKLKPYDFAGHVTLTKGERSAVATICSNVL